MPDYKKVNKIIVDSTEECNNDFILFDSKYKKYGTLLVILTVR